MSTCSIIIMSPPFFVGCSSQWQQQWNAFKDFLHSREGKSAREFAQWIQDTDIFVGTETLNRNELMRFSTTVGCKPTFTTVCYFARETKDDKAVELACQAASSSTERTPDFIKALGGAESKFGTFFTNLVRTRKYSDLFARCCRHVVP
ncbi:EsV-1-206 [Ectocarpus siliculosus virus 1]|uniref:EsV-1-206 n=1 Tax=Ectocarpus siliculosus virus 1 (isolate New Zealand/Kaikoura/1988) TaxID=654926 RepID=Q8QN83_ESV1K|nr:EsV-1-206 [Ectocarpus siliculosus virus 1]AAK14620.1 EsV-1-206 [Ectocarpus siliculosus virus 1]